MAKNSDPSKTLSDIMLDRLKKSPELQAKQAHLIELLKSGTKPELQDVLMNLLTGSEPQTPPSSEAPSSKEGTEEAAAWQKHRQRQRGPQTEKQCSRAPKPAACELETTVQEALNTASNAAPRPTSAAETRAQAKALGTLEESLVDQIEKGQLPKPLKAGPTK